jgi:signal peptidase I
MAKKIYLTEDKPVGIPILEILTQAAVVAVFALFVAKFIFFSTDNSSKSMEPTIPSGAIVFSNRLSYVFSGPSRFDVITFRRSEKSGDILMRRVIGLPGETVRIYRGTIYINDEELDVSSYCSEITSDGLAENGFTLGESEYFVLGDTPANSEDSRMSTVGAVPSALIIGRAWMTAKSITDLHFIR